VAKIETGLYRQSKGWISGSKSWMVFDRIMALYLNTTEKIEYPNLLRFFAIQNSVNSSLFLQAQQVRNDAT
jgi:hypothetical protein